MPSSFVVCTAFAADGLVLVVTFGKRAAAPQKASAARGRPSFQQQSTHASTPRVSHALPHTPHICKHERKRTPVSRTVRYYTTYYTHLEKNNTHYRARRVPYYEVTHTVVRFYTFCQIRTKHVAHLWTHIILCSCSCSLRLRPHLTDPPPSPACAPFRTTSVDIVHLRRDVRHGSVMDVTRKWHGTPRGRRARATSSWLA